MNDFARRDISWVEYNAYFAQANHSVVSVGLTVANHGSFFHCDRERCRRALTSETFPPHLGKPRTSWTLVYKPVGCPRGYLNSAATTIARHVFHFGTANASA